MMTVDYVIVTAFFPSTGKKIDFELPAFLPVSELCPKLLETLKGMAPQEYIRVHKIEIWWNGKKMKENDTLAAQGAWDGSILEIRELR